VLFPHKWHADKWKPIKNKTVILLLKPLEEKEEAAGKR